MEQQSSSFDLSKGIIFEFDKGKGLPDPRVENVSELSGPHTWLKSVLMAKAKSCDYEKRQIVNAIVKTITANSIEIGNTNTISDQMDATHQGLMQYMFHSWAKELGCVLKPDMFFFTVISEIKNQILTSLSKYKHLFTESDKKTEIVLVNLTIDKLMDALGKLIPCKSLFDLITKTSFSTEPSHFKQVMGITMADMGTPYFNYCSTMCGIPKIIVCGTRDDWQKLITAMTNLKTIFEPCCKLLTSYVTDVIKTLEQLVTAVFVDHNAKFFNDMFIYQKNPKCGSGHDPIVLNGWVKKFYLGHSYGDHRSGHDNYINSFPSHMNCLPYNDRDDPNDIKYYFYIAGMCSSRIVDGYLYPEYNIAHCKLTHPDKKAIFDILAAN